MNLNYREMQLVQTLLSQYPVHLQKGSVARNSEWAEMMALYAKVRLTGPALKVAQERIRMAEDDENGEVELINEAFVRDKRLRFFIGHLDNDGHCGPGDWTIVEKGAILEVIAEKVQMMREEVLKELSDGAS